MAGLVQALVPVVEGSRGQHADGAGEHRGFVAQDVAKQVAGNDHVEALGCLHQLHGGVVHQHVVELHIRVVLRHVGHHLFPELRGFEHVVLVDAGQALAALLRRLERGVRDALHLGAAVAHGVETFFSTGKKSIGRAAAAARLAKIHIAGELTDDQDVQSGNQLGFETGSPHQFLVADGRTEIGVQAQRLAQTQNRLLGAQVALQYIVLPVAHGAKQHRVGFFGERQRGGRQRVAVFFVGSAAHVGRFHFKRQPQRTQHFDRFGHDFGADAVTGKDGDFHKESVPSMQR